MNIQLTMYSIKDEAAEAFSQPFFAMNDQVAVRMFSDSVLRDEKTQIFWHPEDFSLFKVGEWDSHDGKVAGLDTPDRIIRAIDIKKGGE